MGAIVGEGVGVEVAPKRGEKTFPGLKINPTVGVGVNVGVAVGQVKGGSVGKDQSQGQA